jgi:2-methylcitrate dehydratase
MNLAERLSRYATSLRYEDIGSAAIHVTKQRIVDALGCALGSLDARPARSTMALAESIPVPLSTLIGSSLKTTPDMAALVNGTLVRYLDFNDGYIGKEVGHPSDNIAACLAVAEAEGASVQDFILSVVLAYEIQCRFQDAANLYRRGWDHVNYVLIASVIAVGRLMKLSQSQLTHAIGIAVNGHIALRQVRSGELSAWKGCSAPNAVRNAIVSAQLARHGMTGPSPIFEGEMGFFKQITGAFEIEPENFGGRGTPFMVQRTLTKMFPTNGELQTAVWAALDLRGRVRAWDDVASIAIDTTEVGYKFLGKDPEKWRPESRETADHSLPYTVARALFDGEITIESYSEQRYRDPQILDFMRKITVAEDPALTALFPALIPNRITVVMKSGERHSKQVDDARGGLATPMSDEDFERKFNGLASEHYSEPRRRRLLEFLWSLESQPELAQLFRLMEIER